MNAIIKERQLTPEQEEELELKEVAPEKFEPEFDAELEFKVNKKASDRYKPMSYRPMTREECAALIAASNAPVEPFPVPERREYPTYTREQVQELMREHFEYLENEKKWKQEKSKWDSQKTTEFDTKTDTKTKPSNSTKD